MQRSLGCHVANYALPMADVNHRETILGGVTSRFACKCPNIDLALVDRLRNFVRVFIRRYLSPLRPDDLQDIDGWLETTHYSAAEKQRFRDINDEVRRLRPKHLKCKLFGKREPFAKYKHVRCINSRHDAFKVKTGRYFAAIEHAVFGQYDTKTPGCPPSSETPFAKFFVKHVPVDRRAEYINARLGNRPGHVYATDYTSFESLFSAELMRAVEFQLYAYMWRDVEGGVDMSSLISNVLGKIQQIRGRHVKVSVPGCRMSGEMCTSLGNGFTNLAVMAFVCSEQGVQWDGVVEGDDGLFVTDRPIDATLFERLGLRLKIVECSSVGDAGFCKFYYDETELLNVVDPRELLCKFGWTHSPLKCGGERVMRGLLRGKAFSLRAEMESAPIASSLWRMVFRCIGEGEMLFNGRGGTKTYWDTVKNVEELNATDRSVPKPVGSRSRLLVERIFDVPVSTQIEIEEYLDNINTIQPLAGPVLRLMNPTWADYWDRYVVGAKAHEEACY